MTAALGVPLAAGLLSAVMLLSPATGFAVGVLFAYLAPLPLLLVGFTRGTAATAVASAAALVAITVGGGLAAALPYAIGEAAPALLVVRQALLWRSRPDGTVEWYPPGLVLGMLTAMAAALFMGGGLGASEGVGVSEAGSATAPEFMGNEK